MPDIFMLDTDICSYLIKNRPPELKAVFVGYRQRQDTLCISVMTYAELLYGLENKPSQKLEHDFNAFVDLVKVIEWTRDAAKKYAQIRNDLNNRGEPIGSMDTLIAAAALAVDATLVTNNEKHFSRIAGLKTANWL
jgi:tRNA(fMet)-specific endonuclease VapC